MIAQRGDDFAERLANAHADAGAGGGHPVLQIGMDTPQVTAELLAECAAAAGRRRRPCSAWPATAVGGCSAWTTRRWRECLRDVPMSQPDTGALTLKALRSNGVHVALLEELSDFDVVDDIAAVRKACRPASRFAQATRAAGL